LANNVKKLQGRRGYHLRVSDYRVIFDQDGAVMDVLSIGPRGSIYED
jgi:mRNA interferase RelE/StbE